MNELLISPEAVRDMESIRQYIAIELENKASAERVIRNVMKQLRILRRYAEAGPSIEALTGFETNRRMLVCGSYIAIYHVDAESVYIDRVMNAKQDYLRVLFGDERNPDRA